MCIRAANMPAQPLSSCVHNMCYIHSDDAGGRKFPDLCCDSEGPTSLRKQPDQHLLRHKWGDMKYHSPRHRDHHKI